MSHRALLVGHGYAGSRFVRVLDHLAGRGLPVTLAGVVDLAPDRGVAGVPRFTALPEALAALDPDVVVVTVNEADHAVVFSDLARHRGCLVLSEKPLTTDLPSALRAAEQLAHHRFSMNLVERFSPILDRYLAWAGRHDDLTVLRAEAFWGKHRLFDARPTMGVLSELIHCLDLIDRFLVPIPDDVDCRVLSVASDYSRSTAVLPDSVDVAMSAGGAPVLLHSSYAWPARMRMVTALVRASGELYRVVWEFDMPHWDCDRLRISRIAADGRWEVVERCDVDADALPPDLAGVGKVCAFVEQSLAGPSSRLVDLAGAVRLQRLLERIAAAAGQPLTTSLRAGAR